MTRTNRERIDTFFSFSNVRRRCCVHSEGTFESFGTTCPPPRRFEARSVRGPGLFGALLGVRPPKTPDITRDEKTPPPGAWRPPHSASRRPTGTRRRSGPSSAAPGDARPAPRSRPARRPRRPPTETPRARTPNLAELGRRASGVACNGLPLDARRGSSVLDALAARTRRIARVRSRSSSLTATTTGFGALAAQDAAHGRHGVRRAPWWCPAEAQGPQASSFRFW